MIKSLCTILACLTLAATVSANTGLTAAQFLTKASNLKKLGPAALLSGDMKILRTEGEAAGKYYRALIKQQRKDGSALHSCPPKKGNLNSGELITHLQSIPAAKRETLPFRSAFLSLMKKKYPCR